MKATLMLDGDQRNVSAMLVSGNYFTLLGARPFLGRSMDRTDDDGGAMGPPVILSHAFWRNAWQEDPGILGRRLVVGGIEYSVAGVMPDGFSGHSTASVDVWVPFAAAMRGTPRPVPPHSRYPDLNAKALFD